ncbi:MAG: DinB family protein [Streptosporangiaceae bacterium]
MTIERAEPPLTASERDMLDGWLEYHRATLAWKCEGLSADQLRERAVPPSSLSLLGLVRHMAEVERGWFGRRVGRADLPGLYCTDARPDADFDDVAEADAAEAFESWRRECDRARANMAAVPSLDDTFEGYEGLSYSLRWIVSHMVEEYARHNGHADLLRERIDGARGD